MQEVSLCELNKWYIVHKLWKKSLWNACRGFYDDSSLSAAQFSIDWSSLSDCFTHGSCQNSTRDLSMESGVKLCWDLHSTTTDLRSCESVSGHPAHTNNTIMSWNKEALSVLVKCQAHKCDEVLSCAVSPVRQMSGRDACEQMNPSSPGKN